MPVLNSKKSIVSLVISVGLADNVGHIVSSDFARFHSSGDFGSGSDAGGSACRAYRVSPQSAIVAPSPVQDSIFRGNCLFRGGGRYSKERRAH